MKNKYNFLDIVQIILTIVLIIFSLVILYQIILKLFGGSWATEDIITNSIHLAKLKSDHNNLSNQFRCLANDFKSHIKN